MVSHDGTDNPTCGEEEPCKTIGYTLVYRAKSNDTIKIDNKFSLVERPFLVNQTYPIKADLTLIGINGRPVILSDVFTDDHSGIVLFTHKNSSLVSSITLVVVNIFFKRVALANFINAPDYTLINITRCVYTHPHLHTSQFAPAFIKSSTLVARSFSVIIVNLRQSSMASFSTGLEMKGINVQVTIEDSYFTPHFDHYNPGIVLLFTNIESKGVTISNTTFYFVSIQISLRHTPENVERKTVTGSSNNVIIKNSNFTNRYTPFNLYGRGGNFGQFGLPYLVLEGGTFIFEHTYIEIGVQNQESSLLIFRNCTFGSNPGISFVIDLDNAQNVIFAGCVVQGPVRISHVKNASFDNCNVTKNNNPFSDYAIVSVLNSNVIFKKCNFVNNSANYNSLYSGSGAVSISEGNSTFEKCIFVNNNGTSGGAVVISGKHLISFNSCHFENNQALYNEGSYAGHEGGDGGAISISTYKEANSVLEIINCVFKGNKAAVTGGSISYSSSSAESSLSIKNTSFFTSVAHQGKFYAGGDTVYSSSTVTLDDVKINDLDHSGVHSSLFVSARLFIQGSITVSCSLGKKITFWGQSRDYQFFPIFNMVNIFCFPCSPNMYSLSYGRLVVTSRGYKSLPMNCSHCPFGGICHKGQIRAAENFWGYRTEGNKIHFINCPFGYCCSGSTCINYDSCQPGREGILCGSCRKGLTENTLTSDCLEYENCQHPWFLLIASLVGIAYFSVFVYWKELAKLIKAILHPTILNFTFKKTSIPESETPLLHNQNLEAKESVIETDAVKATATDSCNHPDAVLESDSKSSALVSGFIAIVINFYQTNVLYKVYVTSEKSQSFIELMKEMLSTAFNLRNDGLFYQGLSWCPLENLRPVSKVFLKMSFIFYLICLVLITYILSRAWKLIQKKKNQSKSIGNRLLQCGLRLILVSYTTITSGLFSVISCVPFHTAEKILFIDGSIKCYQRWQYFVMFIIACWVISFPVALYLSSWLLHKRKMTPKMFVGTLIFPLGAILYWIYIRFGVYKHSRTELRNSAWSKGQDQSDGSPDDISKELLDIVEGPFRKSRRNDRSSNSKLPWQTALIGRRLVLIVIKTFAADTFTQLYVMLLFTVIFLLQHILVQPFSRKVLNHIETGSLFMLTIICGLNILPAFIYTFPNTVSPLLQNILSVFLNIETALILTVPFVLGCCLTILICRKLFNFFVWFACTLIRTIHLCFKPKSS